MRRPQISLTVGVLLVAALLAHQPLRRITLGVLRLPLSIAESLLGGLVSLPQLPKLAYENASLRSELALRQLELANLRESIRHQSRARQLADSFGVSSKLVASIIGRTLNPTQHVVILDRGMQEGVSKDHILLDAEGLVGRVIEAQQTASFAMLLTDPNSRVAAIAERSRELGLVVGTGGGLCQFAYLDLEADVAVRDRVVTAGLGGPFPKGILIGTVVKVLRDERNARTLAWVLPAVRLSRVEEVLCVPPAS